MKWYFPELMYKIKNGITLCKRHHNYIHKQGSSKYEDKFQKIVEENTGKGRIIRKKVIKPRKKTKKKVVRRKKTKKRSKKTRRI